VRLNQARSIRFEVGTYRGRSKPAYVGSHETRGSLSPTPRGSKPIQSYAAPAPFGTKAPKMEKIRPEPPGPPGLTSITPWYCASGTVCRTRETAILIFLPLGSV
jgi:hypothetical protein